MHLRDHRPWRSPLGRTSEVQGGAGEGSGMEWGPASSAQDTVAVHWNRVCVAREAAPITTTQELCDAVGQLIFRGNGKRGKKGKPTHPATRIFQVRSIACIGPCPARVPSDRMYGPTASRFMHPCRQTLADVCRLSSMARRRFG